MSATTVSSPTVPSPSPASRLSWPGVAGVVVGSLLVGLVWGAFARVWMRFISSDPEFSWNGTLFIVGAFGVVGCFQGVAHAIRRRGVRRSIRTCTRVVTMASIVLVTNGPAIPLLVTVIIAPIVITHPLWNRRARIVLGVLATLPLFAIILPLFADLSPFRAVVGSVWFLVVYGGVVAAATASARPVVGEEHRVRPVLVLVPLALALALAAVATIGAGG